MSTPAVPGFTPAYTKVLSGDFDGDGLDDVAGITASGRIQVSLSDGTSLGQPAAWGQLPAGKLIVGDFDGSGRDDIASFKNGTWWVAVSTGTSFVTQSWVSWPKGMNWRSALVGDFNGDGKADVAALSGSGIWWIGISTGTGFQTEQWGGARGSWRQFVVGDFTGDGMDEIAGLSSNGTWWVWVSTGTGFLRELWGKWSSAGSWAQILVGDFSGDGIDDVAGLSKTGSLWVGVSTQTGFATTRWSSHWSGTWEKFLIGDFGNTGRDSIAAFSASGHWYLAASTGTSFQVQREVSWGAGSSWINELAGHFTADGAMDVAGFNFSGAWWFASGATFTPHVAVNWWNGELAPYAGDAPWDDNNSLTLFYGIPSSIEQELFVNNAKTYQPFAAYFEGTLSKWLALAYQQGITTLGPFTDFLNQQMTALFQVTQSYFQQLHPGLSSEQYELLMAMNLAHGHYLFTTVSTPLSDNVLQLIQLKEGCCTQEALLTLRLAQVMGISADMLNVYVAYDSNLGPVVAGHCVVYADHLWLDAETNTAYAVNLDSVFGVKHSAAAGHAIDYYNLLRYEASNRLQVLLNLHMVYSFYDYFLKPDVRQQEVDIGQDGGIISFYYYYYLAGLGQGDSSLSVAVHT